MKLLAYVAFLLALIGLSFCLKTDGRWIVEDSGTRVRLACVNWYGADQKDFVVGGLQQQTSNNIARLIKSLGFNCVRLPWSLQMYIENPIITNRTVVESNLQYLNKRALEIFDSIVEVLSNNGLMVILDNHVSRADWCCSSNDGNGLWYSNEYPESTWIDTWVGLVTRYKNEAKVVGVDLRNELRTTCTDGRCRTPTWGGSDYSLDWHAAAERCGNAILKANPNLLIIVEGINYALDLTGIANLPIKLNVPNRVVYSSHNYQWDYPLGSYAAFKADLDRTWGYILDPNKPYTAPVWLGEFGTCHTSLSCVRSNNGMGLWFEYLLRYLNENEVSWSYWAIDGTESSGTGRTYGAPEVYGILNIKWDGVELEAMMSALKTIQ